MRARATLLGWTLMCEISVLLPVRDAAPWLGTSLASLFRQTFADFEIVAVDDGSRDASGAMLDRAARRDARLRVIHTPPRGLPQALNTGLAAARGRWIARHDADDVSHRRRLELQHAFAAEHPRVDVIGTRLRLFPLTAAGAGMRRWAAWHNALLDHDAMAAEALIDSPLAHGTAMIRKSALDEVGGWAERGWAEDLDLWLRLLASGRRFAKLPGVLYGWRQHAASSTRRDPRYATSRFTALKLEALARGLLADRSLVHLAGTGESLVRWQTALRHAGLAVRVHELRRPARETLRGVGRPLVVVCVSPVARERWRRAARDSDMREMRDFIFVA